MVHYHQKSCFWHIAQVQVIQLFDFAVAVYKAYPVLFVFIPISVANLETYNMP